MKTRNRAGGWLTSQIKSYPDSRTASNAEIALRCYQLCDSLPNEIVRDGKNRSRLNLECQYGRRMFLANKQDRRFNAFSSDRYGVSAAHATMSIFAETLNWRARIVRFCDFAADDFRDLVLFAPLARNRRRRLFAT